MIVAQQISKVTLDQTQQYRLNKVQNHIKPNLSNPLDPLQQINKYQNEADTAIPARPTKQAPGNPEPEVDAENQKVLEEKFKQTKKNIFIGVIILVVVVALTIVAVVLLFKRSGATIIVEKTLPSAKLVGQSEIDGKRVKATDPEMFKSDYPLTIFASRIRRPISKPTIPKKPRKPRRKPEKGGSQTDSNEGQRRLQEQQEATLQEYSSYSFSDYNTGILFSVSSKDLQLRATIDLQTALAYVLSNQPQPVDIQNSNRNLQDQSTSLNETIDKKELTFYQVNDQIADNLKSQLSKQDSNLKVSQEMSLDVQFNQEKNSFDLPALKASPPQQETVAFVDPKDTPVIANINNETEVARAVTAVVTGVLAKAKEFLTKRINDLEKVSNVELAQTEATNGSTSIYVDQPQDIGKLCANIDDTTMRCDSRVLSSSVMNITEGQTVEGRPNIVVYIEL